MGQIDDDLSYEPQELMSKLGSTEESDAFLYLTGFYANENDSPIEVGKELLKEYRNQESDASYEVVKYQESKKAPFPKGELFCKFWKEGCLEDLFTSDFNIENLQTDYGFLVERLNEFHKYSEYTSLTKPSLFEQLPPFQYISATERLIVLNAINAHKEDNSEEAILILQNQISKIRQSIEFQDTLIGKLVFLMHFSDIVDVLSIISYESQITLRKIKGLSQSEKDFSPVSAREFMMIFHSFKGLDKNPELFEMEGYFPGWILRMAYKPNMTINSIAPNYTRSLHNSHLSPDEFAKQIENGIEFIPNTSRIRNYIGANLVGLSPNFDQFNARFMDLDAKIVLFNHLHEGFETAKNPYYDGEAPEMFDNKVCFRGPLEDMRFLRCLRTKI